MVHKPHRKHVGAIVRTVEVPQWIWDVVEQNPQIFEPLYKERAFRPIADVLEPKSPRFIAAQQQKRDAELVAQRQQEQRQREEQQKKDQATADAAKLRAEIAKMNAGQLFAKADELSSSGDSVKAREVLRSLVSRFPDHALAAQAAAQMAGMNASAANSDAQGNNVNSRSQAGAVSNVSVPSVGAGNCWDVLGKREKDYEAINRRAVPAGATPPFMRVMWITADSIKIIDTYCAGDAKAAKYRGELQTAYNQSKTACEQLTAGQCQPNAY